LLLTPGLVGGVRLDVYESGDVDPEIDAGVDGVACVAVV
jgi:hypothetical protein